MSLCVKVKIYLNRELKRDVEHNMSEFLGIILGRFYLPLFIHQYILNFYSFICSMCKQDGGYQEEAEWMVCDATHTEAGTSERKTPHEPVTSQAETIWRLQDMLVTKAKKA